MDRGIVKMQYYYGYSLVLAVFCPRDHVLNEIEQTVNNNKMISDNR